MTQHNDGAHPHHRQVGIWIDHARAVIVVPPGHDVEVIHSHVGGHTRFTGSGGHPASQSAQRGSSEKRFEAQHDRALDRYYDEVAARLGEPDELLVFGPGEAKRELTSRLLHRKAPMRPVVEIETTDDLTDAQIVAYVAEHFGTDAARQSGR